MATRHIVLRQNEEQRATTQECTLDGVRVILRARYASITDRWYLSVYTAADVLIVGSIAIEPGVDLLKPYRHLAIPQGELFVSSPTRDPPTFETLDASSRTLYREA